MKNSYTLLSAFKEAWTRYADFDGRSTRSAYWYWVLANALIVGALYCADSFLFHEGAPYASSLLMLWLLLVFIPCLSSLVRRLHDVGRSGWLLLWLILPQFLSIVSLVILVFIVVIDEANSNHLSGGDVEPKWDALGLFGGGLVFFVVCELLCLAGPVVLLIYALMDSKKGTNKWGPSEKYPEEA
ncbi:MAG: DUF805 domain-containing protein [Akkermansia sp.]